MNKYLGFIYALAAYFWWGIIPIFWKQLDHVPSAEVIAHRMLWACLIVLSLILMMREWSAFLALFKQKRTMLFLLAASMLVTLNWAIFIWAVNDDRIVETALGYFINPLITVMLGVLFFGETLTKQQIASLLIAVSGVAMMVVAMGGLPIVSLSLAITFSLYSVIKKKVSMPAAHGLAIETLLLLLPATAYLTYLERQGGGSFSTDVSSAALLVLSGLFTLIPLLLFAAAAKKVSMTALGMTQYLGPTCQLIIAVAIYREPFGSDRLLAFGLIWLALLIYSLDQFRVYRIKEPQV